MPRGLFHESGQFELMSDQVYLIWVRPAQFVLFAQHKVGHGESQAPSSCRSAPIYRLEPVETLATPRDERHIVRTVLPANPAPKLPVRCARRVQMQHLDRVAQIKMIDFIGGQDMHGRERIRVGRQ